ncbi:DUF4175 family protein [Brevundimonas sp. R86498]|uniref:DUF4175 family protein n=1 Tax=Brevundimonas sp. R86498 TaxID=3093845 RepID=UPI0037C6AA7E
MTVVTVSPVLLDHQSAARQRTVLDTFAIGLPVVLTLAAVGWRAFGPAGAIVVALTGLALLVLISLYRARRFDRDWLIGELDAHVPRFEDSTALLFRDPGAIGGLAALQRARLEDRIDAARGIDLRPGWSQRPIALAWAAGLILSAAILFWPAAGPASRVAPTAAPATRPGLAPALASTRLRITPPAYTGLPVREQTALDARVPAGSRLQWIIGFAPHPASAALTFPEGTPVPLVRDGDLWTGSGVAEASRLYRIDADGLARQRLNRIDVIADAAPVVRLVQPEGQLVLVTRGQTQWTPVFEANDDYGLIREAEMRITVTRGDGENISFERRTLSLQGQGDARRLRFSTPLNLAREGMEPASDLIVQLVVTDNRTPGGQAVEGPSVILRWPADLALSDGLDGMAMRVMPAYFASQRQIIIDAEALIAERRRLEPRVYSTRSNALGEDQAQLRLRYGQFMGEEAEGGGGGGIALPTNDAPPLPTSDAAPVDDHDDHADHAEAASGGQDHGHDHGGAETPAPFGSAVDVLNEFGHAHDTGEAATLFEPRTRSTLALALDAMWSSERALRQGQPDQALPFANQALELLKEAQRATRIFLARTGPDLPPIDLTRRLTGKREDIVAETPEAPDRPGTDAVPAAAWRALEERPGRGPPLALGALERWARDNRTRLADPLGLAAAIDAVRNDPACLTCRRALRTQLWRALERPSPAVRRREAAGQRGQRYLDALR